MRAMMLKLALSGESDRWPHAGCQLASPQKLDRLAKPSLLPFLSSFHFWNIRLLLQDPTSPMQDYPHSLLSLDIKLVNRFLSNRAVVQFSCLFGPKEDKKAILFSLHNIIKKHITKQTFPIRNCTLTFSCTPQYTHRQHIIISSPPPWAKFISVGRGSIERFNNAAGIFTGQEAWGKAKALSGQFFCLILPPFHCSFLCYMPCIHLPWGRKGSTAKLRWRNKSSTEGKEPVRVRRTAQAGEKKETVGDWLVIVMSELIGCNSR